MGHWPSHIQICTGDWVPWLPEGWTQGTIHQPSGDKNVYISPEGKAEWTKASVAKMLGISNAELDVNSENKEKIIKRWPEWLPQDWAITQEPDNKNGTSNPLKQVYIQPGWQRFNYNKPNVELFLQNPKPPRIVEGKATCMMWLAEDVLEKLYEEIPSSRDATHHDANGKIVDRETSLAWRRSLTLVTADSSGESAAKRQKT